MEPLVYLLLWKKTKMLVCKFAEQKNVSTKKVTHDMALFIGKVKIMSYDV